MDIGRVCVKIAGRDAGLKCVVVDDLGKNFVLIDGQTRRRKCNTSHLEQLPQKVDISKGASHEAVMKAFKELGVGTVERKAKAKAPAQELTPRKQARTQTSAPVAKKAPVKKEVKAA